MLKNAIDKLSHEMDQNKNNSYVQVVGGFLLQHLNSNPIAAEKILQEEKTISKSLDEMKKAAEKKKVGNCAVLTDQEGFAVVVKYFGIEENASAAAPLIESLKTVTLEAVKKPSVDFDIDLDDLL